MKQRALLLLASFLSASLLSATPATAQNNRKQAGSCAHTYQGKLEDSDTRIEQNNAPFDLITFSASRGENLYLRLESTAFAPKLTLYQITEAGYVWIESDHSPYDNRSELFPWIYEDGNYAVRIMPNMESEPGDPGYTDAQRPQRGYYTLQISPRPCS